MPAHGGKLKQTHTFSFHFSQKRAKKIEGDSIYMRHSLLMLEVCIPSGDVGLRLYFLALWRNGCCLISRLHVAWFTVFCINVDYMIIVFVCLCVCCSVTLIQLFQESAVEFTTNKYLVMVTLALVHKLVTDAALHSILKLSLFTSSSIFIWYIFFSRSSVFSCSCFCSFTFVSFSNLPEMHCTFSAVLQIKPFWPQEFKSKIIIQSCRMWKEWRLEKHLSLSCSLAPQ